jgi:hypothetical protein
MNIYGIDYQKKILRGALRSREFHDQGLMPEVDATIRFIMVIAWNDFGPWNNGRRFFHRMGNSLQCEPVGCCTTRNIIDKYV